MTVGCHDSYFLLKGSLFLSLPTFLFLFLLRNFSSFPVLFSSWYLCTSSSCRWVAAGVGEGVEVGASKIMSS